MNDAVQVWKTCNFAWPFWTCTSQEMLSNVGVLHLCLETKHMYDSCPTYTGWLLCIHLMYVSRRTDEIAFGVPGQQITRRFWPRLSLRVSHPCLIQSDRHLMNCRPTPRFVSLVTPCMCSRDYRLKRNQDNSWVGTGWTLPDGSAPGGCLSVSYCRFPWRTAAFASVDKCYEWLVCFGWIWKMWFQFTALAARFWMTAKGLLKATPTLIVVFSVQDSNILRDWGKKKCRALCSAMKN